MKKNILTLIAVLIASISMAQTDGFNYKALITDNATVFNGWDKNEADDFSGDFNDLTNVPPVSPTATL